MPTASTPRASPLFLTDRMEILYFDDDIAVAVKPSGVISEGEAGVGSSMPGLIAAALECREIYPVHRLDRETSGIMVYARNEKAAAALSRDVAERRIGKKYETTVHGRPESDRGELRDLLFYDRGRNKSFVADRKRRGVKEAILEYELMEYDEKSDLSRLLVTLHTGRTHQIRVQFASRRMPLFGDRKYGAPKEDGNALALKSVYLSFYHPKTKKFMEFSRFTEIG